MATLDAEIVVPPITIEASQASKPAEIVNDSLEQVSRVSIEPKPGVVRRSRR